MKNGCQEALVTKVARERVGDEIDKMMKGAFYPWLHHFYPFDSPSS